MKIKDIILNVKRGNFNEPENFTQTDILCPDFFLSVSSFIEHNFTGAIEFHFPEKTEGFITVSSYGFSYFLKLLLSEIYGNAVIKVSIEKENDFIAVKINNALPNNTDKILSAARRSGFAVYESPDGPLTLKAKIYPETQLTAYASSSLVFINYLYESFLCEYSE